MNELLTSIKNNNLVNIKHLCNQGLDVTSEDNYPIRIASCYNNLRIVKFIVENGADVTANNNESIFWAIDNGNLEIVKFLVDKGADITAQDNYAIRWASKSGHLDIVKFLVEKGADINNITQKHKNMITAGKKIVDFYIRQRDRKKILNIWRSIVPLYYHPEAKGGYFLKKNAIKAIEDMF